jgi:hypothetical protein
MTTLKATLLAASLLVVATAAGAAIVATDWLSATTSTAQGNLNGITVDVTNVGSPGDGAAIQFYDLSGPGFAPHQLSSSQETLDYAFNENWTATFSAPVTDLFLYCKFWRGPNNGPTADPPNFLYEFDQPFTILTGFGNSSIVGNTLQVPSDIFQDGILKFSGAISSVGLLSNNANSASRQVLTFGVEDEVVPSESSSWGEVKRLY